MNLPNSAGEAGKAFAPSSASRLFIFGSSKAALIARLSFSMIAVGVFLGATTPT